VPLAIFPSLGDSGFHPFAQNITLELGKDRKHPGKGAPRWSSEIYGFIQRNKSHINFRKFFEGSYSIS
jgi:hypothetical protein